MMCSRGWVVALAGVLALALFAPAVRAEKKEVKVTKEWSGSVEDENLMKDAPAVITTSKALEKLWKDWKIEGKVPEVDFTKDIVLIATSRGSKLNLKPMLDSDKGDLQALGFGTRDLRPGFRYVIVSVSKEGVKTVNGKELPKE